MIGIRFPAEAIRSDAMKNVILATILACAVTSVNAQISPTMTLPAGPSSVAQLKR
jgi:hypothetical protein